MSDHEDLGDLGWAPYCGCSMDQDESFDKLLSESDFSDADTEAYPSTKPHPTTTPAPSTGALDGSHPRVPERGHVLKPAGPAQYLPLLEEGVDLWSIVAASPVSEKPGGGYTRPPMSPRTTTSTSLEIGSGHTNLAFGNISLDSEGGVPRDPGLYSDSESAVEVSVVGFNPPEPTTSILGGTTSPKKRNIRGEVLHETPPQPTSVVSLRISDSESEAIFATPSPSSLTEPIHGDPTSAWPTGGGGGGGWGGARIPDYENARRAMEVAARTSSPKFESRPQLTARWCDWTSSPKVKSRPQLTVHWCDWTSSLDHVVFPEPWVLETYLNQYDEDHEIREFVAEVLTTVFYELVNTFKQHPLCIKCEGARTAPLILTMEMDRRFHEPIKVRCLFLLAKWRQLGTTTTTLTAESRALMLANLVSKGVVQLRNCTLHEAAMFLENRLKRRCSPGLKITGPSEVQLVWWSSGKNGQGSWSSKLNSPLSQGRPGVKVDPCEPQEPYKPQKCRKFNCQRFHRGIRDKQIFAHAVHHSGGGALEPTNGGQQPKRPRVVLPTP